MAVDIVDQSLCGNDLLHELGECLSLEALAGGEIFDHAGIEVDLDFIAIADLAGCLWTLNDGQPDIDGIAVEDSGKGLGAAALMAMGACSLEEPQPKFFSATIMSPFFTFLIKSLSISSMQ